VIKECVKVSDLLLCGFIFTFTIPYSHGSKALYSAARPVDGDETL